MKTETRNVARPAELREVAGAEVAGNRLAGHCALFDSPYLVGHEPGVNGGMPFIEVLAPGCFARTLASPDSDVRALFNHNTDMVLGRTRSGTLVLQEDSTGLAFVLDLPDTGAGRDARELVRRGDVTGCSFGFVVVADRLEQREGQPPLRTITDVELHEITPVCSWPANPATDVAMRSLRDRAEADRAQAAASARFEWASRKFRLA